MATNYGFEPTLDGLNNIDSDTSTSTNIICDTIQINSSGTAPTMPPADNSTNISTTAYVDAAVLAVGGVSLSGNNVFTGINTFNNTLVATQIEGPTNTDITIESIGTGDVILKSGSTNRITVADTGAITIEPSTTTNIDIGTTQVSGVLNIGTAASRTGTINIGAGTGTRAMNIGGSATTLNFGTTAVPGQLTALNWGTTSNSGQLIFRGGSFTLSSSGVYTQTSGATFNTIIDSAKSSGETLIANGNSQTGKVDIGTGTGIKIMNVGGTSTTLQLVGSSITFNTVLPTSTLTPTTSTQLTTKTYVDSAITTAATAYAKLAAANAFTSTNTFNSFLPTSTLTPTTSTELTTKTYVDGEITTAATAYAKLASGNAFTSTNTFNSFLPTSTLTPTTSTELTTKTYVDSSITTAGASYAKLTSGNVFTSTNAFNTVLPTSTLTPTTSTELTTKTYVDSSITTAGTAYVTLAGTQTISGNKNYTGSNTFLSLESSLITNTGSIDTPNIGSGLATDPISIVPSQSSGTCNIATLATRTGTINLGTGSSAKILNIGGAATTTNINSLTTTISTSTTTGNGITHSSTATSGDDMRLTATGGYLARIGEGSSSAGLTLLGLDSGTSIIRATTSALQIRADAGMTLTGTISANGPFQTTTTGTNVSLFSEASRTGQININIGTSSSATVTIGGALAFNNIVGGTTFTGTTTTTGTATFTNGFVSNNTSYMSADMYINQTTYPSSVSTQLGYTITKTFGPANISDTAGTYSNIGSQALGTDKGVYFISCGFSLTASGSDTLNQKAVILSLTSGTSGVPVNAFGAWEYFDEINDSMGGGGGLRYVGSLCGTYIKTSIAAATLFLNAYGNTTGAATISCTGTCSITRIG